MPLGLPTFVFKVDVSKVKARLAGLKAAVPGIARQIGGEVGLQIMNDSVMEIPTVPKKTGDLRGSGSVIVDGKLVKTSIQAGFSSSGTPADSDPVAQPKPNMVIVTVAWNKPQAARLHEHPEYNFTEPDSGGKFLEAKIVNNKAVYGRHVANRWKEALDKGGRL